MASGVAATRLKELHFMNWLNQNCESLVWVGGFVSRFAQCEMCVVGIRTICCGNLWIPSWTFCSWHVLQKSELNTSNVSSQCSQCSHRFIQPAFWHPHERRTAIHDACELERREQANRNHQDCGANRPKSIPWLLQTTCVQSNGIFYVHHGVPRIQSKHVDTHTHTHTHKAASIATKIATCMPCHWEVTPRAHSEL